MPQPSPCPDFTLAPLKAYPPDVLNGQDKVDRFVLVLALAFNDLKALLWLKEQTDKCKTTPWTPTATNGQAYGFGVFVARNLLGLMHELMLVVEEAKKKQVLADPRFAKAVSLIPASIRADWMAITSIADKTKQNDPIRKYLLLARNQAAFHYDARMLGNGYAAHFSGQLSKAPAAATAHAYASLGTAMEDTRFYFADAAVSAIYVSMLDKADVGLFEQADKYTARLNKALRYVVAKYLLLKPQSTGGAAG